MAKSPGRMWNQLARASDDPHELRAMWLRALMRRFDARAASVYSVRLDAEHQQLRAIHVQFVGTPAFREAGRRADGAAMVTDWGTTPESLPEPNRTCAYTHMDLPPAMTSRLWDPHRFTSALSWLGVANGRITGNCNVFRTRDEPGDFTVEDTRGDARLWERATLRMLAHTCDLLDGRGLPRRSVRLFRADGSPWMSAGHVPAGPSPFRRALRAEVRAFLDRRDAEVERFVGHTRVRLSRLAGAGEAAVVAVIDPMVRPRVPAFATLSRPQREVAAYAAAGATVPEIAAAIGRSRDTVKSHLTSVYGTLGIASRAELAAAYASVLDVRDEAGDPP